jgi:pyridoxamine 5'-phosphate oxidase
VTAVPITGEPWALLVDWLPANDVPDRPLMTLSTVAADGTADARSLLLSEFGPEGFYFHTDARSRKAAQLAGNASVALTLVWPGLPRQLVATGLAEPAPAEETLAAYRARSRYLQQLAWLNTPEFADLPAPERVTRWRAFDLAHPDGFDPPDTWVGYLVRPTRLTFWQGDPATASLRQEFTASAGRWIESRLPG